MFITALRALLVAGWLALAGCASVSTRDSSDSDDPLEPLNRTVLDVNLALDDAFIKPAAEAYRALLPAFVRDRIRSVIDNFAEPRILANDLLQGRPDAAWITLGRFILNTFAGIGGMFDAATPEVFPRQSGDFGQTLYAWGVGDGPYVVLLFFGPSNLRDAFGLGVDIYTTPPALVVKGHAGTVTGVAVGAVDGIDLRARNIETLDEIKSSALDFYASLKSLTRQRRAAELRAARGGTEAPVELIDPGGATPGDNPK